MTGVARDAWFPAGMPRHKPRAGARRAYETIRDVIEDTAIFFGLRCAGWAFDKLLGVEPGLGSPARRVNRHEARA